MVGENSAKGKERRAGVELPACRWQLWFPGCQAWAELHTLTQSHAAQNWAAHSSHCGQQHLQLTHVTNIPWLLAECRGHLGCWQGKEAIGALPHPKGAAAAAASATATSRGFPTPLLLSPVEHEAGWVSEAAPWGPPTCLPDQEWKAWGFWASKLSPSLSHCVQAPRSLV